MQAIFDFKKNKLVAWTDVTAQFPKIAELEAPRRWEQPGANRDLGRWLSSIRRVLSSGRAVSLENSAVRWVSTQERPLEQVAANTANQLVRRCEEGERVVVLRGWMPRWQKMAVFTAGRFQCVEPFDSQEGRQALHQITKATGVELADSLLAFASVCCTGVTKARREKLLRWARGEGRGSKDHQVVALVEHLRRVGTGEPGSKPDALIAIARYPEIRTYRRELFYSVLDALRDVADGRESCPLAAFAKRRQATSRSGRRVAERAVGTPQLLKGLEFEHVVLADDGQMSARELYVAMTRATRSLTVVGASPKLTPSEKRHRAS